ncbi:MAG TPA: hypothetical protein VLA51_04140, partial [Paracoccaceae bacterium]|nr:hypothetical protein [Paracoccaceae bacterium]
MSVFIVGNTPFRFAVYIIRHAETSVGHFPTFLEGKTIETQDFRHICMASSAPLWGCLITDVPYPAATPYLAKVLDRFSGQECNLYVITTQVRRMTETIPAIQYLFLTHGKKPEPGKAIHHPAARLQVSNIRAFLSNDEIAKRMSFKSAGVAHDYVRNTSDFQQLAGLRSALSYVHHNTPAVVIMDDLTRLFRSTDYSESEALLDMLAP